MIAPVCLAALTVKAATLLVLTLGVMRIVSWAIGWVLARAFRSSRKSVRIGANLGSFALFAGFLVYDRLPGELLDVAAFVFGLVTFSIFALLDFWWWPWKQSGAASGNHERRPKAEA